MSDTDTEEETGPEKTNINIRLTESFLEDVDATWQEEGFNSRSEFVRFVLRDAVKHPSFTRESWKEIASEERKIRDGAGESYSRENVDTVLETDGE